MSVSFHVDFNGQCQEAFEYYAEHLGGVIRTMQRYTDSPAAASVLPDWQQKIIHANISLEGIELAGTDLPPEQYQAPRGFYLLLGVNTANTVRSIFDKLAVKGRVIMLPQKTFWSPCYGVVVDRFSVPWKINCGT